MKEITASVNPQIYLAQMIREIGGSLGDFRNSLRTIEDESFSRRSRQKGPNIVVHIEASDAMLVIEATTQRAIDNCFLAMTRSALKLVDWTLALTNAVKKPITDLPIGTPVRELSPFFDAVLKKYYSDVAADTRLNNPRKLELLGRLPELG